MQIAKLITLCFLAVLAFFAVIALGSKSDLKSQLKSIKNEFVELILTVSGKDESSSSKKIGKHLQEWVDSALTGRPDDKYQEKVFKKIKDLGLNKGETDLLIAQAKEFFTRVLDQIHVSNSKNSKKSTVTRKSSETSSSASEDANGGVSSELAMSLALINSMTDHSENDVARQKPNYEGGLEDSPSRTLYLNDGFVFEQPNREEDFGFVSPAVVDEDSQLERRFADAGKSNSEEFRAYSRVNSGESNTLSQFETARSSGAGLGSEVVAEADEDILSLLFGLDWYGTSFPGEFTGEAIQEQEEERDDVAYSSGQLAVISRDSFLTKLSTIRNDPVAQLYVKLWMDLEMNVRAPRARDRIMQIDGIFLEFARGFCALRSGKTVADGNRFTDKFLQAYTGRLFNSVGQEISAVLGL